MTLITAIPVLFVLIGALMYGLCANPKLAEIGRLMLAAGLFAIAFAYAGRLVNVLK